MRKQKKGRKFSRKRGQRKAFLKSITLALLKYEKIRTTEARAKEVSPLVQKLITKAKSGKLSSIRALNSFLGSKDIVKKLISDIAPRYKSKKGGYVRIIKLGPRKSDGAKMAIIELI